MDVDSPAAPRRGRPRRSGKLRIIKVRESTFHLWNQKKESLGYGGVTQSEFAEILLHRVPLESSAETTTPQRAQCE